MVTPEWRSFRMSGRGQRGENCRIFGGQRVDFIQHYAAQALRTVLWYAQEGESDWINDNRENNRGRTTAMTHSLRSFA